ncbi:MAG: S1/P1 nuclease [Verrucomicrobiia bacterium]
MDERQFSLNRTASKQQFPVTIKMIKFLTSLCACFCLSHAVLAWNGEGHMVVAQIAYNHLDSEVKAKCDALIALPTICGSSSHTFVSDSTWADQRCEPGTSPQHYIDLPISLDGYPTNGVANDPTNVVSAIRQYIATLQNPTATLSNQATALRYLIHFVGDIEQPLHCSTGVTTNQPTGDSGGNGFSLGGGKNLHSFWDGGGGYLTDGVPLSNKVAAVEAAYPYSLSVGTIPDPMDWAVEGWEIARTNTYVGITNGLPASGSYSNRTQATTEQRMAIGGQRLAKLLSTIFVTNAPSLTSVTLTNGNFSLSWSAVSGRSYRVQWKQQLDDAVWNDLTDITASTNSISFTDPIAQEQQRFYRVMVVN